MGYEAISKVRESFLQTLFHECKEAQGGRNRLSYTCSNGDGARRQGVEDQRASAWGTGFSFERIDSPELVLKAEKLLKVKYFEEIYDAHQE